MSGMRLRCHRNNVSGLTIQPCRNRLGRAAAIAPSRLRSSSVAASVLVSTHAPLYRSPHRR